MKRFLLLLSGAAFLSYASAQEKTVTWPDASTHTVKPAFTLTVQVAESVERTFSFGTYNEFDFYAVDFGDGNLVLTDTIGYTTSTVTKTAVTGVATGDGVITVYAEDPSTVYYVTTSTGASTDSPVLGADFSKLTKVNTLSVVMSMLPLLTSRPLRASKASPRSMASLRPSTSATIPC